MTKTDFSLFGIFFTCSVLIWYNSEGVSNVFLLNTLGKDKLSHGFQIKLVKNGCLSFNIYIADK